MRGLHWRKIQNRNFLFKCPRWSKTVEARQVKEETNQANATGPDFNADHMKSNHESV
jgi:hypothetical protein